MLQSNLKKEPSKAEMKKKVEAWKTINSVLVGANAEFMNSLNNMLKNKEEQLKQLQDKANKNEASEEESATLLFLGGYTQCLKDILYAKKEQA